MKDLSWSSTYETYKRLGLRFRFGIEVDYGGKRKSEFVSYNDTIGTVSYHEDKIELKTYAEYSDFKTGQSLTLNLKQAYLSRRMGSDKDHRYIFEPEIKFKQPIIKKSMHLGGKYSHNFSPSGFEMNNLRIYTSYNLATAGTGKNSYSTADLAQIELTTNVAGWIGNIRYNYIHSKFATLYESTLANGVYIRESVSDNNRCDNHSLEGSIGKERKHLRTKFGLNCRYDWSHYCILLNEQKGTAGNNRLATTLSLSMRPWKIFNFEEQSSFTLSKQYSTANKHLYRSFSHALNLFVTPTRWVFAMKNECYHSTDGSEKFFIFSSTYAAYKNQKYELRLDCKNLWGYNKREYKSISALGTNYSVTEMRPREFLATLTISL